MPARPSYFHRLGDAIATFRGLPSDWIDRRTVEETLGVSKTVAWRLLRRCGASDGPGNTLVCRRDALVAALEGIYRADDCQREVGRRDRLECRLGQLLAAARSRHVRLAPAAEGVAIVSSRFDKLPDGVSLTRRELIVQFDDSAEFLRKIGAVVFALQNDYEAIREFIDAEPASNR